jgi:hypothetical protein
MFRFNTLLLKNHNEYYLNDKYIFIDKKYLKRSIYSIIYPNYNIIISTNDASNFLILCNLSKSGVAFFMLLNYPALTS